MLNQNDVFIIKRSGGASGKDPGQWVDVPSDPNDARRGNQPVAAQPDIRSQFEITGDDLQVCIKNDDILH